MSFAQLAEALDFRVKEDAIRSALLREGFHRRLAMRKPPVSEKNRQLRLQWLLSTSNRQWINGTKSYRPMRLGLLEEGTLEPGLLADPARSRMRRVS